MTEADFSITDIDIFARNALREEGHNLSADQFHSFLNNIAQSVTVYSACSAEALPSRVSYNALKRLWVRINQTVPSIGLIRAHVLSLPRTAKNHLMRRGALLWPSLLAKDFSERIFDAWVRSVNPSELIRVLQALINEGGMIIKGRKDRKSQQIFEPMIMGIIRGTGEGLGQGGRPSPSSRDELVMHLAIDWLNATGMAPHNGRSEKKGFAGLVHAIFNVLEIKSAPKSDRVNEGTGAEQALRRYWSAVQKPGKASSSTPKSAPSSKRPTPSRSIIAKR